jgi:Zn-dependent membrane protease YugP
MVQEQEKQAAKQALKVLRSCGVKPTAEQKSMRQVLDAYLRSYGMRAAPVIAVRELLARHAEQQPAPELYGWLTQISMA